MAACSKHCGTVSIDASLVSQSAALAFYALLSLAPLLLILLWVTASMLPSAREALLNQIGTLVGSDTATVARIIVANAKARPDTGSIAGIWSLLLLLFGATAVFGQLQDVLNQIFRTDAKRLPGLRAWLRKRVFSFGLVLALGLPAGHLDDHQHAAAARDGAVRLDSAGHGRAH